MQVNSIQDMAAAVRGRRQDLGLSQADLAKRVGVSRVWVNSFEAGKPTVAFGLVLRLLDALGLSIDLAEGGGGEGSSTSGSINLDHLLDEYRDR